MDKFPGKRGLRKGAKYTLEFALLADGVPTSPENMTGAMATDTEFWVEHGENLEQRFNAWAAR